MKFLVTLDDASRIDKYLIGKLELSRSKIQEMIKENLIKVNDRFVKNSYQLKENDVVEITGMLHEETDAKPEKMKLEIIYEDDDVMVVNKPSGLVVHPAAGHFNGTLVNGLLYHTKLSSLNGDLRPGIVHRIDKDTSGLLIIAKNDKAHEDLSKQLQDRTLSRTYLALVDGVINHDTGTIDAPIGRDSKDRKKMSVTDVCAKEAITDFKVLDRYKTSTLIEAHLRTGRTHQIRVHMAYIGHPVINDPVYGKAKNTTPFRQMLHAYKIKFKHPTTGKMMEFTCDAPKEFEDILNKYKNM